MKFMALLCLLAALSPVAGKRLKSPQNLPSELSSELETAFAAVASDDKNSNWTRLVESISHLSALATDKPKSGSSGPPVLDEIEHFATTADSLLTVIDVYNSTILVDPNMDAPTQFHMVLHQVRAGLIDVHTLAARMLQDMAEILREEKSPAQASASKFVERRLQQELKGNSRHRGGEKHRKLQQLKHKVKSNGSPKLRHHFALQDALLAGNTEFLQRRIDRLNRKMNDGDHRRLQVADTFDESCAELVECLQEWSLYDVVMYFYSPYIDDDGVLSDDFQNVDTWVDGGIWNDVEAITNALNAINLDETDADTKRQQCANLLELFHTNEDQDSYEEYHPGTWRSVCRAEGATKYVQFAYLQNISETVTNQVFDDLVSCATRLGESMFFSSKDNPRLPTGLSSLGGSGRDEHGKAVTPAEPWTYFDMEYLTVMGSASMWRGQKLTDASDTECIDLVDAYYKPLLVDGGTRIFTTQKREYPSISIACERGNVKSPAEVTEEYTGTTYTPTGQYTLRSDEVSCPAGTYILTPDECQAAGLAMGGQLQGGSIGNIGTIVQGAWGDEYDGIPAGCSLQAGGVIHFNTHWTMGPWKNNGYQSVCRTSVIYQTSLPGYDDRCPPGTEIMTEEECGDAGKYLGGNLRNGAVYVDYAGVVPCGCSYQSSGDGAVHLGASGTCGNGVGYTPVCRYVRELNCILPCRSHGEHIYVLLTSFSRSGRFGLLQKYLKPEADQFDRCPTGMEISSLEECHRAGLMMGGSLRDGSVVSRGSGYSFPCGCSLETGLDNAIHFGNGNNCASTTDGSSWNILCRDDGRYSIVKPAQIDKCPDGMDIGDAATCREAGLLLGGKLLDDGNIEGANDSSRPCGCSIYRGDYRISFNLATSCSAASGSYISVCNQNSYYHPVGGSCPVGMTYVDGACRNRKYFEVRDDTKEKCRDGAEITSEEECKRAGLLMGGILLDEKIQLGPPCGCSIMKTFFNAISFNSGDNCAKDSRYTNICYDDTPQDWYCDVSVGDVEVCSNVRLGGADDVCPANSEAISLSNPCTGDEVHDVSTIFRLATDRDQAAELALGSKTSVGLVCAYAETTGLPGYCCLDAPFEREDASWGNEFSCDDGEDQCNNKAPGLAAFSEEACAVYSGTHCAYARDCTALKTCIDDEISWAESNSRSAYKGYLSDAPNITDTGDSDQCGEVREYFGYDSDYPDDDEICDDVQYLRYNKQFDNIDATFGSSSSQSGVDDGGSQLDLTAPETPEITSEGYDDVSNALYVYTQTLSSLEEAFDVIDSTECAEDMTGTTKTLCAFAKNILSYAALLAFFVARRVYTALEHEYPSISDYEQYEVYYNVKVVYDNMVVLSDSLEQIKTQNTNNAESIKDDIIAQIDLLCGSQESGRRLSVETATAVKFAGCDGVDQDADGVIDNCEEDNFPPEVLVGSFCPLERTSREVDGATLVGGRVFSTVQDAMDVLRAVVMPSDDCAAKESLSMQFTVATESECNATISAVPLHDCNGVVNAGHEELFIFPVDGKAPSATCGFSSSTTKDKKLLLIQEAPGKRAVNTELFYQITDACSKALKVDVKVFSNELDEDVSAYLAKTRPKDGSAQKAELHVQATRCERKLNGFCHGDGTQERVYEVHVTATDDAGWTSRDVCRVVVAKQPEEFDYGAEGGSPSSPPVLTDSPRRSLESADCKYEVGALSLHHP
ncbi:expressed unknown protein [Seminavis robusta]|uniref:Uncharacterized protein n=1 Tax=Seminavis robusta TaxID=568900 RepID=A0A9N8HT27_9STRA|nr:expressed unknown protein [Seminavis robusta]|eukprot:Sro1227_g254320.1 n/a (1692) ;mRNA; r:18485-24785